MKRNHNLTLDEAFEQFIKMRKNERDQPMYEPQRSNKMHWACDIVAILKSYCFNKESDEVKVKIAQYYNE